MKAPFVCAAALLLAGVSPSLAQTNAEYCFGSLACQYMDDTAFTSSSPSAWSYSSGSGWSSQTDTCNSGSTGVADLAPGDAVWQYHATDDLFENWTVELDFYLASSSFDDDDRLIVSVNNGLGTSESHTVYASEAVSLCGQISIPLSHDYGGYSNVRVHIRRGYSSTVDMYIDNVSLLGSTY